MLAFPTTVAVMWEITLSRFFPPTTIKGKGAKSHMDFRNVGPDWNKMSAIQLLGNKGICFLTTTGLIKGGSRSKGVQQLQSQSACSTFNSICNHYSVCQMNSPPLTSPHVWKRQMKGKNDLAKDLGQSIFDRLSLIPAKNSAINKSSKHTFFIKHNWKTLSPHPHLLSVTLSLSA